MNHPRKQRRWRFTLRSLMFGIAVLSVFFATTLSSGRPKIIFRFSDGDGGAAVYARNFGWPVPYLRVPTGDHLGKIPADLFLPGLIVDLTVTGFVMGAALIAWKLVRRSRSTQGEP